MAVVNAEDCWPRRPRIIGRTFRRRPRHQLKVYHTASTLYIHHRVGQKSANVYIMSMNRSLTHHTLNTSLHYLVKQYMLAWWPWL